MTMAGGGIVQLGAHRIHYADPTAARSDRLPVVLVHGSSVHMSIWETVIDALSEDFRPIAFSHPGHAGSSLPACPSVDALTELLERLYAELKIERSALIGFSLGGAVAQLFHDRHPGKIAALGLISTAPHFGLPEEVVARWRGDPEAYRADEESLSFAPNASPAARARIARFRREVSPEGQTADLAACADWSYPESLRGIACPLLVMTASHDIPALKDQAERWAHEISQTRLVEIADAGHFMLVEQPQAAAAAVRDWLLSLGLGQ